MVAIKWVGKHSSVGKDAYQSNPACAMHFSKKPDNAQQLRIELLWNHWAAQALLPHAFGTTENNGMCVQLRTGNMDAGRGAFSTWVQ